MTELVEEEILLPWDAVDSPVTRGTYLRDSKWFLEFGRFVDPKVFHHRPGPRLTTSLERQATADGMADMIKALRKDPQRAKAWSSSSSGGATRG
jgi:hypothetical protein